MEWGSEVRAGSGEVVGNAEGVLTAGWAREVTRSPWGGQSPPPIPNICCSLPRTPCWRVGLCAPEVPIQLLAQGTLQSAPAGEHAPS